MQYIALNVNNNRLIYIYIYILIEGYSSRNCFSFTLIIAPLLKFSLKIKGESIESIIFPV
jgi:hypothetical protein